MKIIHQDAGFEARLIITGNLFEAGKINALIDKILLTSPPLRIVQNGFFVREIIITGVPLHVLCAEAILHEAGLVVEYE
ncbi:hypothetical protein OFY73_004818 [Salmonella enterica]|nr:hypothetical protein [Salmonella enterica subsp. enterica serovar Edinburgh]EBH8904557.1 hypothetical protein [Salmonella enterica subsp. enterica serovar 6,7:b:-]EBH8909656.1 hypothetical protein [Salmonella enterica subsp. enterica serovar Santiago]EHG2695564.1 hypothetical protein [Salmonella enterica]EBH8946479.1 hypothetical protein [Salmonella enterica subsp. enterica serovar 6,7:b:-]